MRDHRVPRALRGPTALLLLLIPLGAGVGALSAALQPPMYRSTAVLFISSESPATVSALDQGGASPIAPRPGVLGDFAANGYAGLARTSYVLDAVIRQLGLHTTAGELAQRVHAERPSNEVVTRISVDDTSPSRAADIANAIAIRLHDVVAHVEPATSSSSAATVVTRAVPATTPALPNLPLDLAAGAVAGALAAGAVIGLRSAGRAARREPKRPEELALVPAHGLFEDRGDLS